VEDSRNIIKAIDALTLKVGGEVVDSKNITEAIDNLKAVYDQKAIRIDKTLTQEGLAADAKAVGDVRDKITKLSYSFSYNQVVSITSSSVVSMWFGSLISIGEHLLYVYIKGTTAVVNAICGSASSIAIESLDNGISIKNNAAGTRGRLMIFPDDKELLNITVL